MSRSYIHIIDAQLTSYDQAIQLIGGRCEIQSYDSGIEFFLRYVAQENECMVLNLALPDTHGLEVQHELARRHWTIPVISSLAHPQSSDIVKTMQAGACDFVEMPFEPELLQQKIERALEVDRANKAVLTDRTARLTLLSPRERQVLEMLLEAGTIVQIAHQLHISPKTAEKHRAHIFEKMNVISIPELMRLMFLQPRAVP